MSDKCNQKVEELTTDSKNGFVYEVKPILQLSLRSDIKKLEDFSCEIIFHTFLNQTKRNIYLQNYELNEEFENSLKEAYPFIKNAIKANIIKLSKSNTTAIHLTFNLQEQPYTIYIPKQSSDTAAYNYQDPPMICDNCHKYEHTKTRCRRKGVWNNCGEDNLTNDKNNECPNESKCANCGERHMAGSNNCQIEIKERIIKKMQADSRVGRRRALQFLAWEDESPRSNPQSHYTHFRCKMDPEKKRKFNPWAIEKSFTQEIGSKPATIRSNNESEFCIWISNKKENKILPTIKSYVLHNFKKWSKLNYLLAIKSAKAKTWYSWL